jgi:flagellin
VVVRFGSNILSLNVQRQLGRASDDLSSVSQRLSSGQRINKASDDAAGLAIASSLRTDARVFTQGIRNLNDGLSALAIAESAMDSLGSIVDRIQELSTQAMSGTFGDTQRASMQREVTGLQAEWNRIVESTSFNGNSLLTGESTRTVLQGGKGVEGTLAVQIGESRIGTTTRISTNSFGTEATGGASTATAISADGRFVAFTSTKAALPFHLLI